MENPFTVCPFAAAGIHYARHVNFVWQIYQKFSLLFGGSVLYWLRHLRCFNINRKARISVNLKQHICDMQFNAVAVTLKS